MKQNKRIVTWLCTIPFWWIVMHVFWLSPMEYPFWSQSLFWSGYTAVSLLALCLGLRRFKKTIGLASFFYALLHMNSYFIKKVLKTGAFPWMFLVHPIIIFGELAFLILLAMALTSNRFSVDRLGRQGWKRLHRTVYLAEGFIFIHMVLQGGTVRLWAFIIFVPLITLQVIRKRSGNGFGRRGG